MPKDLNAKPTEKKPVADTQGLEQFLNDPAGEVTEERLNKILQDELNKPESEMDMQLIHDVLEALEPETADAETIEAGRQRLSNRLQAIPIQAKRKSVITYLRRIALVAAALVLLFLATLGSARAMRWTFLLKLLEPIAQTFGIYGEDHVDESVHETPYQAQADDSETIYYPTAEDVPITYEGYRIRLNCVPERYQYYTGSLYEDPDIKILNVYYQHEEEMLSYTVQIFKDDETELGFLYEKKLEDGQTLIMGTLSLTYYHNSKDNLLYASWIDQDAHYCLNGNISESELEEILNGWNK